METPGGVSWCWTARPSDKQRRFIEKWVSQGAKLIKTKDQSLATPNSRLGESWRTRLGPEGHATLQTLWDNAEATKLAALKYEPRRTRRDEMLVTVDVAKVEASYSKDTSFYVGPGGSGASISNRYERFKQWLRDNPHVPIDPPNLGVTPSGAIIFGDGRHRWAVLRDMGETRIPVLIQKHELQIFKDRYGAQEANAPVLAAVSPSAPKMLTWYHGSVKPRDAWDLTGVGLEGATDQEGPGLYFTTDLKDAMMYGEYIAIVRLQLLKNRTVPISGPVSEMSVRRLIRKAPDLADSLTNWDENPNRALDKAGQLITESSDNPHDAYQSVYADFYDGHPREFFKALWMYDGVVVPRAGGIFHAIVYKPEIIKTVRMTTKTELNKEAE